MFIYQEYLIKCMELRELKREVEMLPDIRKSVRGLQDSWFKHVNGSAVSQYKVFDSLPNDAKKQVGVRVAMLQESLKGMEAGYVISEKLRSHARCLVDLKLTQFNGDTTKAKVLMNTLLKDEYFSVPKVIGEIKQFENHVLRFSETYHEVNELMQRRLSLEEALFLMDLPHKLYLATLLKTTQKQRILVRDLSRQLVGISKEHSLLKTPHK